MSGHSKFANIKHKKEKNDAAKGKIFTKIGKEIVAFFNSLKLENGAVKLAVRIRPFISIVQDRISPLFMVGFRSSYSSTLTLESKVEF